MYILSYLFRCSTHLKDGALGSRSPLWANSQIRVGHGDLSAWGHTSHKSQVPHRIPQAGAATRCLGGAAGHFKSLKRRCNANKKGGASRRYTNPKKRRKAPRLTQAGGAMRCSRGAAPNNKIMSAARRSDFTHRVAVRRLDGDAVRHYKYDHSAQPWHLNKL